MGNPVVLLTLQRRWHLILADILQKKDVEIMPTSFSPAFLWKVPIPKFALKLQTLFCTCFTVVSVVICSSAFAFVSSKSELNTFASVQTRIGQARIQFSIQNMTVACKKGKKEKGSRQFPTVLGIQDENHKKHIEIENFPYFFFPLHLTFGVKIQRITWVPRPKALKIPT